MSPENPAPLPPVSWKILFKRYFLPSEGRELHYMAGIAIDIILFAIWLSLIFTLLDEPTRKSLWYIPLLGIVGGTVAMATPAGGGIFYFPALIALQVPTDIAVAFNFGAQFTGMGVFGTLNWVRKSYSNVIFWMIGWLVLWGWVGSVITMLGLPITNEFTVQIIFALFSLLLIIYVLIGLKSGNLKAALNTELSPKNWKDMAGLAFTGFIGGLLMGWISVGIDVAVFFALTAYWGVDSRRATVTSVLVGGWSSFLPLLIHICYFKDVPYALWLMVVGGSMFGAKIGPLINKIFGKTIILILFVVLLIAEVIRTIVELATPKP
eukprot:TRINITY_DN23989_c0_g1_i1.p1 TRINITY_DN23989_c0_g1~~TRINITY_DN23989_c0_g1_i1.p1  ORF type:complete len:375 (+),score=80.60 TRINITY_DN23989_c0_g1_i1:161-1126(+)